MVHIFLVFALDFINLVSWKCSYAEHINWPLRKLEILPAHSKTIYPFQRDLIEESRYKI